MRKSTGRRSLELRWDVIGGFAGLGTAAIDLGLFAFFGLELPRLLASPSGVAVLVGFVSGFSVLGFALGRLYIARARARADAARIQAQLEALEESRLRLSQSEKLAALGRLAAGIAHEVRNPLGVIRASASMIQEGLPAEGDDHRASELIVEEIDRLDALIGALLAFARPAKMELAETALEPALERAARLAAEARPTLSVTVSAAGALSARADGDLLTQLVLSLLVNAAEAGATEARVDAERSEGGVRVAVEDDGPGVEPSHAASLFEPFFTTKPGGTGLGLAMAARIAKAHGGSLELEPSASGARFVLRLLRDGPRVAVEAA